MNDRPEIPEDLVAACANALRAWTTNAGGLIAPADVQSILAAEFLSVAQGQLSPERISALLREMARRIEAGELTTTLQ